MDKARHEVSTQEKLAIVGGSLAIRTRVTQSLTVAAIWKPDWLSNTRVFTMLWMSPLQVFLVLPQDPSLAHRSYSFAKSWFCLIFQRELVREAEAGAGQTSGRLATVCWMIFRWIRDCEAASSLLHCRFEEEPKPIENSVYKVKGHTRGMTPKLELWPPQACTHVCTCIHSQTNTYTNTHAYICNK